MAIGHSRGAAVSLINALDHPAEVAGVIAWNGSLSVDIFSDEEKEQMRIKGRAFTFNARTQQQMPLDRVILDDIEQNHKRFNILDRMNELTVPTVLIQGSDDFLRLKRLTQEALKRNPTVDHIEIDGGSHTFNAVHPFKGTTELLEAAIAATLQWIRVPR